MSDIEIKGWYLAHFSATGNGDLVTAGTSIVICISSGWACFGEGGIEIKGTSLIQCAFKGTWYAEGGGVITLVEIPEFPDRDLYLPEPIVWDTSNIEIQTFCECQTLPQLLIMSHDFNKFAKLDFFLSKNQLTLPSTINLSYNSNSERWQALTHFTGLGLEDKTNETWILKYDWACINAIEGVSIGDYAWEYSLLVSRIQQWQVSNLTHRTVFKMVADFARGIECKTKVDFSFKYSNTIHTAADLFTGDLAVNLIIIDNIGLLDGATWQIDPTLTIKITEQLPSVKGTGILLSTYYHPEKITIL